MLAFLLAAATPQTAVDAERAFAAAAQRDGQWTAFRRFAAPDATMFVPHTVQAQQWLKDRKDPPRSVPWSPARSFVSCDGTLAVNTGPWRRPDGSVGYFTTIWYRQKDGGWKWGLDHGDTLTTARAEVAEPEVRRAACSPPPVPPPILHGPADSIGWDASRDGTLRWWVQVQPDGARRLRVYLWTGKDSELIVSDEVAAPVAKP